MRRFSAVIDLKSAKGLIRIPFDPNVEWGKKDRHYITGTVGGCKIRGPLVAEAGQYFLSLGAAWLRDNRLEAGKAVEVVLQPEGPQVDRLAPDIVSALDSDPSARAFFESLATFYRKGYVNWIEEAKRPETREARVRQMMECLKAGQKQR
jgi:hypothetical protein